MEVVGAHAAGMVWAGGDPGAGSEWAVGERPGDPPGGGERAVDAHLRCLVGVDRAEPQVMLT